MGLEWIVPALGIASTLLGLWVWWIKRKQAPTAPEQIYDQGKKYGQIEQRLQGDEASGNYVDSDGVLDELRTQHGAAPERESNE